MKPHLTYYLSLADAMAMFKKMNTRKHRAAGYSFSLSEREHGSYASNISNYREYKTPVHIVKLEIFYEKPNGKEND